ncbi:MAG: glycosyl transferase [Sphingomonadales bacterium]|nr:glycosyl transferase [Sphingomonadales bacterium]
MSKIAFILLTHKDPEGIIRQAERLTAAGDYVSIHFDARANPADHARIQRALAGNPSIVFARKRHKCGWGEWSLVAASLEAVRAAAEAFPEATHFYMLSGDCMQIKTAEYAHAFLDAREVDYIESFDFFASDWIKTGIKEERLIYRHYFNERVRKRLFYLSLDLQQRFGLKREIPADLQIMIGSQWWCLRRATIEKLLAFCAERRDVMRFFATTWIPDETFFQTLVRHLVPDREIETRSLTFLMFTDYGMPVTFYNDHYDLLLAQNYLFARKISPEAQELKDRLGVLWCETGVNFPISNEGRRLFSFLTGRGRVGRRFAPRFWETESSLGHGRTLLMVVCKKWHVAKRLVEQLRARGVVPAAEYLFHEMEGLPDLGGIEKTMEKRTRHRRALVRMLFDWHQSERLLICLDPADIEMMRDFSSDKAETRVLEIECDFSDDYLLGHARRVGLAGERTPPEVIDRMLPTIRYDLKFESDRMRDADFPGFHRLREGASPEENAAALAAFLGIAREVALEIVSLEYLFVD